MRKKRGFLSFSLSHKSPSHPLSVFMSYWCTCYSVFDASLKLCVLLATQFILVASASAEMLLPLNPSSILASSHRSSIIYAPSSWTSLSVCDINTPAQVQDLSQFPLLPTHCLSCFANLNIVAPASTQLFINPAVHSQGRVIFSPFLLLDNTSV